MKEIGQEEAEMKNKAKEEKAENEKKEKTDNKKTKNPGPQVPSHNLKSKDMHFKLLDTPNDLLQSIKALVRNFFEINKRPLHSSHCQMS